MARLWVVMIAVIAASYTTDALSANQTARRVQKELSKTPDTNGKLPIALNDFSEKLRCHKRIASQYPVGIHGSTHPKRRADVEHTVCVE